MPHAALAFNRAASPYHAAGLADWARRFRDHVGLAGGNQELVRAYLADRHGIEQHYDRLSGAAKAQLAVRQGAGYVLAARPPEGSRGDVDGSLQWLHTEGRYAVYRVRSPSVTITDTR